MSITNMLRNYHEIKWTPDVKTTFRDIEKALTDALVLASPDFNK